MLTLNRKTSSKLIPPYGGKLVNLLVPKEESEELKEYANQLPAIQLTDRSVCDLELLATGGFSPLDRFVGKKDFAQILNEMRLTSGHLFPIPVSLPVSSLHGIKLDHDVALVNAQNEPLAVMMVEEIYEWDFHETVQKLLGTEDLQHPLVVEMKNWGCFNIAGTLKVLQLPKRPDFQSLRLTPMQTREHLDALHRQNVVAFQTRNPLHRAHEELTKRAMDRVDGVLFLHPVVGVTKPGDIDYFTRVRTYQALIKTYYDSQRTVFSLLPLAMRLAGPREAVWHALIRRNYGANYLIVGRDHASPGMDSSGKPFFEPFEAQRLLERFNSELAVGVIPFTELTWVPSERRYAEAASLPVGTVTNSLSGKQLREQYLNLGKTPPEWFVRPEVARILMDAYPPRHRQGVCIWFTGLSGSGKSTTGEILRLKLLEIGRKVTLLDGDVVRTHLSKGLTFSKVDRDSNVRRLGYVAGEVVKHGGIVICCAISPYRSTRNEVQNMVGQDNFVEVFVDTPIDVCEQRDTKGVYAKARRGELKGLTGIDDPYEAPLNPSITLDTISRSAEANALGVLHHLQLMGFLCNDEIIPKTSREEVETNCLTYRTAR